MTILFKGTLQEQEQRSSIMQQNTFKSGKRPTETIGVRVNAINLLVYYDLLSDI